MAQLGTLLILLVFQVAIGYDINSEDYVLSEANIQYTKKNYIARPNFQQRLDSYIQVNRYRGHNVHGMISSVALIMKKSLMSKS